ncbi:Xanthine dehydrogenase, FAD binding subunit [Clostridiaceae bacterium JG1575]|nr:Xanthine dehydrogenase, FAD binding subunit [Clostridiaceae bacterium JG1575]
MKLLRTESLDEGLIFLAQEPNVHVLAGGTDLIIQMRKGTIRPEALLDASAIPELKIIRRQGRELSLGAALTYRELVGADLPASLHGLKDAAHGVGSPQIRNTATLGGNICNASPAGDIIPPLLALDAQLHLMRWVQGAPTTRRVALSSFLKGKGQTDRAPEELLTHVSFEVPADRSVLVFQKLGLREALAISRICLAVAAGEKEGRFTFARIATGSLGETALREPSAEQYLTGAPLSEDTYAACGALIAEAAENRLHGRSTLPFKREAIQGLLTHALRAIEKEMTS